MSASLPGYRERRAGRAWSPALLVLALIGCTAPNAALAPTMPAHTPAPETLEAELTRRLVSLRVDAPPEVDGLVEAGWEATEPLRVPLTWGTEGTKRALDMELRSLHTDQALYLLARWPGAAPDGPQDTAFNVLTVHWRVPDVMAQHLDCTVVCHTAFGDGDGRLAYANAETIPQGGSHALDAAGGWSDGVWTIEWSRPLISGNPYDLQFDDRELAYSFQVKVFARVEGRPDPTSERHLLVFQP